MLRDISGYGHDHARASTCASLPPVHMHMPPPLLSPLGDHSERLLESFLWLLHRTSAFDSAVKGEHVAELRRLFTLDCTSSHYNNRCSDSDSNSNSISHFGISSAPPSYIGVTLLLYLRHASIFSLTSTGGGGAEIAGGGGARGGGLLLVSSLKRCMHGITESLALPGLLAWMPAAFPAPCVSFKGSSPTDGVCGIVLNKVSSCPRSRGAAVTTLVGTFFAAAVSQLAGMSAELTTDSGEEISQDLRDKMKLGIRQLVLSPLWLINNGYSGVRHYFAGGDNDNGDGCVNSAVLNNWRHLIGVWLQLEIITPEDNQAVLATSSASSSLHKAFSIFENSSLSFISSEFLEENEDMQTSDIATAAAAADLTLRLQDVAVACHLILTATNVCGEFKIKYSKRGRSSVGFNADLPFSVSDRHLISLSLNVGMTWWCIVKRAVHSHSSTEAAVAVWRPVILSFFVKTMSLRLFEVDNFPVNISTNDSSSSGNSASSCSDNIKNDNNKDRSAISLHQYETTTAFELLYSLLLQGVVFLFQSCHGTTNINSKGDVVGVTPAAVADNEENKEHNNFLTEKINFSKNLKRAS